MPNVTVEYYGVTGVGKNVTDAKKQAGEQIKKALEGSYSPSLIRWREYIVLMWREPTMGWGYKISHPAEQGVEIRERMWLSTTVDSADHALRTIARHIGDIARPYDEDPELTRPLFDALIPHHEVSREFELFRSDMRRNYTFQARWHYAKDTLGMAENDAHNWAGMNPCTYESWKGSEGMFATPPWEEK